MISASVIIIQGSTMNKKELIEAVYAKGDITKKEAEFAVNAVLDSIIVGLKAEGKAEGFFTSFFDKLLGQKYVRVMIEEGCSEAEIRARWRDEVEDFKRKRQKYLIYEP